MAQEVGARVGRSALLQRALPSTSQRRRSRFRGAPLSCLRLILGDQLNARHSWFRTVDDDVVYVLMEVRGETDYVRHNAQ